MDEDRREKYSSLEFANIIVQMQFESCLPEALSEGCKIRSFRAGLGDDEQLVSSYWLLIGDAPADIFADTDDYISSTTTGMHSKKVSKLLPYPIVCSWRFYWFEVEGVVMFWPLNHHVIELSGRRLFKNMVNKDVVVLSSEVEDLETAIRSIIEATSWTDWWTFTFKFMAPRFSQEVRMLKQLCVAYTRYHFLWRKLHPLCG